MRLFKPQFALKSLFVLTALIGCLLAYPVWWIHKRHELLANYAAELKEYAGIDSKLVGSRRNLGRSGQTSLWLLKLFGEPFHDHIEIVRWLNGEQVKVFHLLNRADRQYEAEVDDIFEKEVSMAEKYFPEADIQLSVYVILNRTQLTLK